VRFEKSFSTLKNALPYNILVVVIVGVVIVNAEVVGLAPGCMLFF
jgi:hypothetical protein